MIPEIDQHAAAPTSDRVTFFIPSFGDGGVERMMVNTARGIAMHGTPVDFIIKDRQVPYVDALEGNCRIVQFHGDDQPALLEELLGYLERERPAVLISAKGPDDDVTLAAKARTSVRTRFFLRPGTNISGRMQARGVNPLRRWLKQRSIGKRFRMSDGIIAVSEGVAEDITRMSHLPREQIHVIRNPVVTPELESAADAALAHPWFADGAPPVIIGMGGLRTQKDFPTLLRAFARVHGSRRLRLMILGEGRQRQRLLAEAERLGVADDFALPGFVANPYPYLRRASLFVLSSLWEGSPNVLSEALAVGTPVVATDCPSGPREILQGGRYGPLLPIGDVDALADAIDRTLTKPLPREVLREAVRDYTMEKCGRSYLEAFGLRPKGA